MIRANFFLLRKTSRLNKKRKDWFERFIKFAKKRPVPTFLILIGLLFILIGISHIISRPQKETQETTLPVKEVSVYTIGEYPKITVQAKIEKSGVVKVVALGPGVVQAINVEVGQDINKGTNLISMSTNYQGGNALSVVRQLAQVQYQNVLETFETNKEIIEKQRELAEKSDENSDELRNITNDSLDASRSLVDLNNNILSTLEAQQAELEATNVGGANDAAILQTKQLRSQLESGNLQLESALRNSEYLGSGDKAPAEISDISREIAIKQLELQEKALALNKEISRLSVVLAQINEAIMYPASPVPGVVERIYVKVGQAVNPGTPIAQITGDSDSLIAVGFVSREIASGVSTAQVSALHFGDETYESAPFYVSKDATDGSLYSVQFAIPSDFASQVTDKSYITIDIPVGIANTGSTIPFVPVDSVFQTQDQAFVYVANNGYAESRKIVLGQVLGRFVEVTKGLSEEDQVILDRFVITGDPVKTKN